jgi:hypothetical protein
MPFSNFLVRVLKWQFHNLPDDDSGVSESRGYVCEYIAWQFLTFLSHRETIDFLLQDLRDPRRNSNSIQAAERGTSSFPLPEDEQTLGDDVHERTPLLTSSASSIRRLFLGNRSAFEQHIGARGTESTVGALSVDNRYSFFTGLNALEIATIANAKKLLSQKVVQKIIDDIWQGEIVFWDTLSVRSRKNPKIHNKRSDVVFFGMIQSYTDLYLTFSKDRGPFLSSTGSALQKGFRSRLLRFVSHSLLCCSRGAKSKSHQLH